MKKKKSTGIFFIAPLFMGLTIFYIVPVFKTIFYSFTDLGAFGMYSKIDSSNYKKMMLDSRLHKALTNTLKIVFISVPFILLISLIVAVLLNSKNKNKKLYNTIYLIPSIIMPSLIALIWRWLLNSEYGFINAFLNKLGISSINWLSNKKYSIYVVIFVYIWSKIGYSSIILQAGLRDIPKEIYEAAALDGAGDLVSFAHITVPLLAPSIFFVVTTTIIDAFQIFDLIFIMITENSVAIEETQTLIYLFYKNTFMTHEKGYGSAIAVLTFFIILALTSLGILVNRKYNHYEE